MSARSVRLQQKVLRSAGVDRTAGRIALPFPAWRSDALAVGMVLLVTAGILVDQLRSDEWLTRTDLLAAYIPFNAFLGDQLRSFDLPGWSPHQFAGITFVGDPQSGWMYFPAMFFYTLLPPLIAMKVFVAFHLLFGAVTMYAFARVLGLGPTGSFMATAVFAFGANVYQNTWCCTIWSQASTWVPLCLLGVELGLRRKSWSGRAVGWGMTGIGLSQIVAGWLGQGAYNAFVLVGAYLAYRALLAPPNGPTPLVERVRLFAVSSLAVYGLGLGLAAAGLLPRLDANQYTNLAGGLYSNIATNSPGWRWEAVVNRVFDARDTFLTRRYYIGGVAISLALVAPLVVRTRHAVPFFAMYTVVLLALVVKPFWLHRLFYILPRYQELHEHTQFRVWGLLMIGPAVLAGATVDTLSEWSRRRWAAVAAVLPLIVVQVVRIDIAERYRLVGRPSLYGAAMVTGLLLAAAILHWPFIRQRWPQLKDFAPVIPFLLIAAVLWEPTGRQMVEVEYFPPFMPPPPQWEQMISANAADTDPGGAGEFLQEQQRIAGEPFRYFGYDAGGLRTGDTPGLTYQGRVMDPGVVGLLVSARATRLGLEDVQGYNPIQSARYVTFLQAVNDGVAQDYHDGNILPAGLDSPLLDLLNVRYIVIPATVPPGRPDLFHLNQRYPTVFANGQVRVLERSSALPRAWIVHEARTVPDDDALAALAAGEVDPRQVALLADPSPPLVVPTSPGADEATIEQEDENRIALTTATDAAGLLTLSEVYDPGWHAYVDGERVDLLRANYTFRAVPIPAGTHSVELRYEPASLRYGMAISLATALLLAGIFATATYRRIVRRKRT